MDNENPPENGTWLKRIIVGVYFLAVVILIPFFIWPLVQNGTHNPKMEAMVISTVFLVLTLPISIYSVASHLGKFKEATHIVCSLCVLFWGTEWADFHENCTETSF